MSKKRKSPKKAGEADSSKASHGPLPDRATLKKAKRFLADVERLLAKNKAKVDVKDQEKLNGAMQGVREAMDGNADGKRLSTALKELDARADQILGFAKKSTSREYTESIVVAVLIAVVLRAFVFEAFKIPTGSMIPTLAVGDHIFVNKFIYGLRVPLTNRWFVEWGSPERGDVIVFRYPRDLSKDYIKRVVAVAGDRLRVEEQDVYINGKKLQRKQARPFEYLEEGESQGWLSSGPAYVRNAIAYPETSQSTDLEYTVLYDPGRFSREPFPRFQQLPGIDCGPNADSGHDECVVKEDYVFVMGDNRDNSSDSRFWGGVPTSYVKGKAMFVWMSFGSDPDDVKTADGTKAEPSVFAIRWGRIGTSVH